MTITVKHLSGQGSKVAVNPSRTGLQPIKAPEVRDWAGRTPCCRKSISVSLGGIKDCDTYYYYRKCPGCGCMVEVQCKQTGKKIGVVVEIVKPTVLWGGSAPKLQRWAIEEASRWGRD